ncbi:MAG: serine/threonine protein kinase [Clostridiales bacterium]|jgi:predicted Ser/Thr protein kinase|nr:serine/threonine protein kinase [Clostridiales bacterium]
MYPDTIMFVVSAICLTITFAVTIYLIVTNKKSKLIKNLLNEKISKGNDITRTITAMKELQKTVSLESQTLTSLGDNQQQNENLTITLADVGDKPRISSSKISNTAFSSSSQAGERYGLNNFNEAVLEGKYKVESEIFGGGMSRVFIVKNTKLGNRWILKYIPSYFGKLANEEDLLRHLNHPGLPKIVDIFNDTNGVYLIESYIEGITLSDLLKQEDSLNKVVIQDWAEQLAQILMYLHSLNITHLDIKPSNVILTFGNRLVLIDFGIAKYNNASAPRTTGITFQYAAPEQLPIEIPETYAKLVNVRFGDSLVKKTQITTDERTDIYSFGVVIFRLLTGVLPTVANQNIIKGMVSKDLADVILKCMAVDPSRRYQSAQQVLLALRSAEGASYKLTGYLTWRRVFATAAAFMFVVSASTFAGGYVIYADEQNSIIDAKPMVMTVSVQHSSLLKIDKVHSDGDVDAINADDIRWEFSDNNIAAFDGARVLGLNLGKTQVTGSYRDKEVILNVNVVEPMENLTQISQWYRKDSYADVYAGSAEHAMEDGLLRSAAFYGPESMDTLPGGTIYVIDSGWLRKINGEEIITVDPDKPWFSYSKVRTFGNDAYLLINPYEDESGTLLYGIEKLGDPDGIYLADYQYSAILDYDISNEGVLYFIEENYVAGGIALKSMGLDSWKNAELLVDSLPGGTNCLTCADDGSVYLASSETGVIQKYKDGELYNFAGISEEKAFIDGDAPRFYMPVALRYVNESLYVLDYNVLRRIQILDGVAQNCMTVMGKASPTTERELTYKEALVQDIIPSWSTLADVVVTEDNVLLSDPLYSVIWRTKV